MTHEECECGVDFDVDAQLKSNGDGYSEWTCPKCDCTHTRKDVTDMASLRPELGVEGFNE